MLHLYAALAEKERQLIGERTRSARSARKAQGARQVVEADRFAANVLPVVRSIQSGQWHLSTVQNLLARAERLG